MSTPWIVAFGALWVVTLLLAAVVLGLLRRVGTVLESAEVAAASAIAGGGPGVFGAAPGTRLPAFEATTEEGRLVDSAELLREGGVFVFMERGCEPCKQLAGKLDGVGARIDGVPLYVVVGDGQAGRELSLPPSLTVLYQHDGAVSGAFESRATPQAFAVDSTATVVERIVPGTKEHLGQLAARCKQAA